MELNFTTYVGLSIFGVLILMYVYTLKTNNDAFQILADEIKVSRNNKNSENLTSENLKPKRKINPDIDD